MPLPTIVQSKKGDAASGASITFDSPVTAGNLLLVLAGQFTANGSGLSVSDTRTNSWTPASFNTTGAGGGNVSGAWFSAKAKDSGPCTINIGTTFGVSGGGAIFEISLTDGSNPINGSTSATSGTTGTNAPASGPLTTTVTNCLLIGGCFEGNNAETFSAGSGWTLESALTQGSPANIAYAVETQNATSAGSYNAQFGMTIADPWVAFIIAIAPNQNFITPGILTVPENHAGTFEMPLVGTGSSWGVGTTFTVQNTTTDVTLVGQIITDATHATLTLTTGAGTGTFTISDGTLSGTATVAQASLSVSPSSGSIGAIVNGTATGANTLWTQENEATLLSVSGSGSAISNIEVISDTEATFTLSVGGGPLTITDKSTGATASFGISNLNCQGGGASPLDTGVVAVNSTSSWVQIGILQLGGWKRGALLTLKVGSGGALGHLRLTRADSIGGLHVDWLVDTDFNTATDELQDCLVPGSSPPNIYQLVASGVGQMKLAKCLSVAEIGIWAKAASSSTTLRVTGSVN